MFISKNVDKQELRKGLIIFFSNGYLQGCGKATVSKIVGGQLATENQLPWQCMVQNNDGSFYGCGAVIISCDPVILISAAHCFDGANP